MKTYFKEIIDLGHEYYNDMPNLALIIAPSGPGTFEHTARSAAASSPPKAR